MKKLLFTLLLVLFSPLAQADQVEDLNQALTERRINFEKASQISDPAKRAKMHREAREVFVQKTNKLLPAPKANMFNRFFQLFR